MPEQLQLPTYLDNGLVFATKPFYSPDRRRLRVTMRAQKNSRAPNEDLPEVKEARAAVEKLGINVSSKLFDVVEATEQTVEAMNDLGLVPDRGEATEAIAQQMQHLYTSLSLEHDQLDVFPFMGLTVDDASFSFRSLTERYNLGRDQIRPKYTAILIEKRFWDQYQAKDINARTVSSAPFTRQARSYPLAMVVGPGRNGISYARKDVDDQIDSYAEDAKHYNARHDKSTLVLLNPVDYLIINAIKRVRGDNLLDCGLNTSTTRFVGLPSKLYQRSVEESSYSHWPAANWLRLDGATYFRAKWDLGSRGNGVRTVIAPTEEAGLISYDPQYNYNS